MVMSAVLDFLKAILVGLCVSAPVGPVAILVLQNSLTKGRKPGFITGLGATTVDTTFSIVALFALNVVQGFIDQNSLWIMLIGGVIVAGVGVNMALSDPFKKLGRREASLQQMRGKVSPKDYLKAVAMGFTNPGAIAIMFALFAFFGLSADPFRWTLCFNNVGVACGSIIYWFTFSYVISRFSDRIKPENIVWVNRVTGGIVVIIGLVLLVRGAIGLL